jgi:hypothetical protein
MTEMFVPGEKAMLKGKGRDTMAIIGAIAMIAGMVVMVMLM